jgi:predicted dehydrogenase
MTNLMKINDYREQRFAFGSAPDLRTLKRLIDDGELAGKRIGKIYYIEVDKHLNEFSVFEKEVMNHG